MRIARFTLPDVRGTEPRFGVVEGPEGDEVVAVIEGDPLYRPVERTGEELKLADVRLLAPVIPRSKVIGIGKNYRDHAAEMGGEAPPEPLMFIKPNTAVVGPDDAVVYPHQSSNVHYEGELAVVIGRICKDVPLERVPEVVLGYTVGNDVTARDLQAGDGQWSRAKGFDTFCPLGPWIETEIDPARLRLTTTVNGEVKQDGSTADMVHDVAKLVAHASQAFTLLPGDVILTGTPAGVGPVQPGDVMSVTIEGIGTLTNRVVARD